MARLISFLMLGMLVIAAGCQSQSVIANLPSPNFGGPTVAPARTPVATAAPTTAAPVAAGGLDRGWNPTVASRPWKWIVIHHSATPGGSAAVFDKMHREKGWDELGYHFVIGNGTDSGNGQIEVGSRWSKQKQGAHAKTADNRYNELGVGICLVGNFDIERPTQQQLQALAKITSYIMQKYRIPASNVVGHRDTKPTECPGRNLNVTVVRRMATQMLADAGQVILEDAQIASGTELLSDIQVVIRPDAEVP